MKKAAIILMGICLCLSIPVAAEAAQTGTSSVTQQSTINTTVPDTHMVTIRSEHAQVSYQHEEGDDEETQETVTYAVERFSSPQFQIRPKKGWKITAVLVNGEDVTDQLKDGMLTLPEVSMRISRLSWRRKTTKKMIKKTIPPEAVSRKIKNLRTQNLQIKSRPIQKITELPAAAIPGQKSELNGKQSGNKGGSDRHDEWNGSGKDGRSAKECNVFYGGNCIRCGTFDSGRQPEKKKTRRIDKQTERKAKKGR